MFTVLWLFMIGHGQIHDESQMHYGKGHHSREMILYNTIYQWRITQTMSLVSKLLRILVPWKETPANRALEYVNARDLLSILTGYSLLIYSLQLLHFEYNFITTFAIYVRHYFSSSTKRPWAWKYIAQTLDISDKLINKLTGWTWVEFVFGLSPAPFLEWADMFT